MIEHRTVRIGELRMHVALAGQGDPLVLLHGWPQTWYCWRKVIPRLAGRYRVIAPDLRGYGDTDKPATGYDKRTMAADVRALVRALGHARIKLVGHDRGGRVAHRFALDYPGEVERLAVLDIVPTRLAFERMDARAARASWHWLFHQVPDLPELLVGANVEAYLRHFYRDWGFQAGAIADEDVAVYVRAYSQPGALRAGFDDYRAGATLDVEQDRADADARVEPPLLVLWGAESTLGVEAGPAGVLDTWRGVARDVRGEAVPACGHFMAEEQPEAVARLLLDFFA
jgi:haloacetate dehalogenase